MRLSRELIAASARPLVLSVLSRGESYGYAIIQEVEQRSAGQIQWTEGMLYPVLHRLEREELISSYWHTENGRKRKYYRLNQAGTKVLTMEREQWSAVQSLLSAFLEPKHG